MRLLAWFLLICAGVLPAADPKAKIAQILYFKAKPGQFEAYNQYIKEIADPIDEDARKAGAFAFSKKMDEAGVRVFPDEKKRQANGARSASLRDRVGEPVVTEILTH
jgi:hypothetical protein